MNSGWIMGLFTHLHLVLRSRMHAAIPTLPQYVVMVWCSVKRTGTTLFFVIHLEVNSLISCLPAKILHEYLVSILRTNFSILTTVDLPSFPFVSRLIFSLIFTRIIYIVLSNKEITFHTKHLAAELQFVCI